MAVMGVIAVLALLVELDVLVHEEVHFGIGRINLGLGAFEQTKILDAVVGGVEQRRTVPRPVQELGDVELEVVLEERLELGLDTFGRLGAAQEQSAHYCKNEKFHGEKI